MRQGIIPNREPARGSCRACPVRCERVVYPASCVATSCARLYAHRQDGVTWIGCVDKVFTAEVDVDALRAAEAEHPGFGALRADGAPREECTAAIDRTFPHRHRGSCTNPSFRDAHPESARGREPIRTRPA